MKISVIAFGSEKFTKECRSVLGEVCTEGKPGPEDIVLIEHPRDAGLHEIREAKKYLPARIFVISPPSLEVWRAATEVGVTVLGSVGAVTARLDSLRGIFQPRKSELRVVNGAEQELVKLPELPDNKEKDHAGEEPAGIMLNSPIESTLPEVRGKKSGSMTFKKRGRLICVYSLIGGVGKTTISLNMAELLRYYGKDVCLVDYDFKSIGSTVYFWPESISPPESILLWEDFPADMRGSREMVEDFLARVPFGFHMLPAPKDLMLSSLVSDVLPGMVLDVLLDHFDYVIADMGTDLDKFGTKKSLSMADTVLMVARPDSVSLSGAVRFLSCVGPGKLVRPERLRFIVNLDRPRPPKKPSEVAESAGLNLDFLLPKDDQSLAEADKRHTLPVNLKGSPLGDALTGLVRGIIPDLEAGNKVAKGKPFRIGGFIKGLFKKKGDGHF